MKSRNRSPVGRFSLAKFRDLEHLLRLLAVFVAGFVVFLLLRSQLVPRSFGQYGHYRGKALEEIAAYPVHFAGHQACQDCHSDVSDLKKTGKHAGVNCEACHGALAQHADDPTALQPQLPDTSQLCPRCHEANVAKPAAFPQVDSKDHSAGQPCKTCHQPHSPLLQPGAAKS